MTYAGMNASPAIATPHPHQGGFMNNDKFFAQLSNRIAIVLTLMLLGGSFAQATEATSAKTTSYTYSIPADSINLYPDASWLPAYYKPYYPDLAATIQLYTQQSVTRSGLKNTTVKVAIDTSGVPQITLTGSSLKAMKAFAETHQGFLDATHSVQGLDGVNHCKNISGCWDPHPDKTYPWAFFLPFGMAMVNQPVVNFMNYPPAVSLVSKDYLDNATMKRWSGVLGAVGISNPVLYETIVDGRPIAAAGTGQSDFLPDINTYFNSPGNYYVTPMISLLAASKDADYSKAVVVLGAPAGNDWAEVIGASSVKPGDVGTTDVIAPGKKTNWVAGNHPNVTSYQCCPGDLSPACQPSGSYPASTNLIPDEKTDLMVACIEKGLGENPSTDVNALKASCKAAWNPDGDAPLSAANQHTLCVRARLDYTWSGLGNCKTSEQAEAFCKAHADNACAINKSNTQPYPCCQ